MNLKPLIVICMFLATAVLAAQGESLEQQLEKAANTFGPEYLAARGDIIRQGQPVLSPLRKAAENPALNWHQRLMARICCEWLERGAEIDALRRHAWKTDPEFKYGGHRAGVGAEIRSLAAKRFKERRLWYYYLEVMWKKTGEHQIASVQDGSIYSRWPEYGGRALQGEPEEYYTFQIRRDILRRDPQIKDKKTARVYAGLVGDKRSEAMPELLLVFPHYIDMAASAFSSTEAGKNKLVVTYMIDLLMIARPQDVEAIEKLLKNYPNAKVPEQVIDAVRKRPPVKEPVEPSYNPAHEPQSVVPLEQSR